MIRDRHVIHHFDCFGCAGPFTVVFQPTGYPTRSLDQTLNCPHCGQIEKYGQMNGRILEVLAGWTSV